MDICARICTIAVVSEDVDTKEKRKGDKKEEKKEEKEEEKKGEKREEKREERREETEEKRRPHAEKININNIKNTTRTSINSDDDDNITEKDEDNITEKDEDNITERKKETDIVRELYAGSDNDLVRAPQQASVVFEGMSPDRVHKTKKLDARKVKALKGEQYKGPVLEAHAGLRESDWMDVLPETEWHKLENMSSPLYKDSAKEKEVFEKWWTDRAALHVKSLKRKVSRYTHIKQQQVQKELLIEVLGQGRVSAQAGSAGFSEPVPLYKVLVDTGATISCVSEDVCNAYGWMIKRCVDENDTLMLANGSTTKRVGVAEVVVMLQGGRFVRALFEVMRMDALDMIIGLDLFPSLHFYVGGLPGPLQLEHDSSGAVRSLRPGAPTMPEEPERMLQLDDDAQQVERDKWREEDKLSDNEVRLLKELTRDEMMINMNIPDTTFCSHPLAKIGVETDGPPDFKRPYPVPDRLKPAVREKIQALMKRGIVVDAPIGNLYNSPLCVVPKKGPDGVVNAIKPDIRMCLDLRGVNNTMKDRKGHVPLIAELIDKVHGFSVASAFDLKDGYHQVEIEENDRHKLAFMFEGKRYMFARAPFGLKMLVPYFQGLMETMLEEADADLIIYLDDVIVYTIPRVGENRDTWLRRHAEQCNSVWRVFNKYNLRVNTEKLRMGYERLRVLGHLVDGQTKRIDPVKIEQMANWPVPRTGKDVQRLLGFCNYVREHIPLYAILAAPLEELKGMKNIEKLWASDVRYQRCFDAFVAVLKEAPVLQKPLPDVQFEVYTDASKVGVGAVLLQREENGIRYICFSSKALAGAQKGYSANRRELLAIVFALQQYRCYLYLNHFTLHTDHKALCYMFSQVQLNDKLAESFETIQQYSFEIRHVRGIKNVLADSLSRVYETFDDVSEMEGDNVQQFVSSPVSISSKLFFQVVEEQKTIRKVQINDPSGRPTREFRDFVKRQHQKTVPATLRDRQDLLMTAHEEGHYGDKKLYQKVWDEGYYWDTMMKDARELVLECSECIMYNVGKYGFHPQQSITEMYPWEHLAVDNFKLDVDTVEGHTHVLVIVDVATRFTLLRVLMNEKAVSVAKELWEVCCMFGFPKRIQSDNGPAFVNSVLSSLCELVGVNRRFAAAYNPRANGLAENGVKQAKYALRKMCGEDYEHAHLYLSAVQLAVNNKNNATRTGSRPFELLFGRPAKPVAGEEIDDDVEVMNEEDIIEKNEEMLRIVYPAIYARQQRVANASDEKVDEERKNSVRTEDVVPGTRVFIRNHDYRSTVLWSGPYFIVKRVGNSYVVKDSEGAEQVRRVPRDQLKIVRDGRDENEEEYEVDFVIADKVENNRRKFLVKWKGYSAAESTWEDKDNFNQTKALRDYFEKKAASEKLEKARSEYDDNA
jgi:transposase InsO family protein